MNRLAHLALVLAGVATPGAADTIVAAHTIRAQAILSAADVVVVPGSIVGAYTAIDEIVGQEARVAIYAGRPVRHEEVGPPAVIERNQIVTLIYASPTLNIVAEGRALGRAGVGDLLKVMNLTSRQTVTGAVRKDGTVSVSPTASPILLQGRSQ